MYILKKFPAEAEMLKWSEIYVNDSVYQVNGHIHTVYSFSAFTDIKQIFIHAKEENIKILGINDFYVTDGYDEFYDNAIINKIFPLFNLEFIALMSDFQQKGIRLNDPYNPGRIYISGKGLDYPERLTEIYSEILTSVKAESISRVKAMVDRTNDLLSEIGANFNLDFLELKRRYAKDLVLERHIAKALRIKIFEKYPNSAQRKTILTKIYNGKKPKAALENNSAIEIEIRNRILKAGGRAFIKENEKAFLEIEEDIKMIISAGGIPCYPMLLDDINGNITEFEADKEILYSELTKMNIFCIEFIPGRNDFEIIKDTVHYFYDRGFIILFGTEHNTPDLTPLTISCRNNVALDETMRRIGYEGACIIAAHQYLRAQGQKSRVYDWNRLNAEGKKMIMKLGKAVIQKFIYN